MFDNHYPLGALDPPRGAKNVKYNNLIPTYTSKNHYTYKTRGGVKKCNIPMCLTRMEFEHFWDTPPNNLLSRLKHRGGGMLKIVILLCA
jgi:hypothetical protein